eukprot:COSAG06_NODE_25597_length_633_cov_0.767790_1_plen_20_part_10
MFAVFLHKQVKMLEHLYLPS